MWTENIFEQVHFSDKICIEFFSNALLCKESFLLNVDCSLYFCFALQLLTPPKSGRDYPMFIFVDGASTDHEYRGHHGSSRDHLLHVTHFDKDGKVVHEPEEFVFL